uniref:Uncharacterized protein n=1 Tax=Anopheles quadriannulatus TaxID=34691 RepID=A0A182XTF0_ANOQN
MLALGRVVLHSVDERRVARVLLIACRVYRKGAQRHCIVHAASVSVLFSLFLQFNTLIGLP